MLLRFQLFFRIKSSVKYLHRSKNFILCWNFPFIFLRFGHVYILNTKLHTVNYLEIRRIRRHGTNTLLSTGTTSIYSKYIIIHNFWKLNGKRIKGEFYKLTISEKEGMSLEYFCIWYQIVDQETSLMIIFTVFNTKFGWYSITFIWTKNS